MRFKQIYQLMVVILMSPKLYVIYLVRLNIGLVLHSTPLLTIYLLQLLRSHARYTRLCQVPSYSLQIIVGFQWRRSKYL